MGYKEKYNTLVEAIKVLQEINPNDEGIRNWVNDNVPELEESEDERIRKVLIGWFNRYKEEGTCGAETFNGIPIDNIIAWLEKQAEQKPADVEQKFHEGDTIVSNQDGKVYTVGTDYYVTGDNICLHDVDGNHKWTNKDDLDRNYHLWTIEDAKDGDVLVCDINKAEIGGDIEKLPNITPTICIYHNVVKDQDFIHTYCSLYNRSYLRPQKAMYYNTFVYNIHPANQEQRDLLFQTMKEAGYEWVCRLVKRVW